MRKLTKEEFVRRVLEDRERERKRRKDVRIWGLYIAHCLTERRVEEWRRRQNRRRQR